jgi:tetratricopeptide (TPR) repeat protein
MKKDTTSDTRHIRSIFALDKFIKSNSQNGLKYASKYYADDDHGSVPLISEYDGLRFIFSWYRFKFLPSDFSTPGTEVVTRMKQHYQTVSKEFGFKVSPPEMQINGLGYFVLGQKHLDKAAALFEMNVENYPQSGNAYDSYADALIAKKDTIKAISNYEKAYALTKSEETKNKLDKLQGKSTLTLTAKELEKYVGAFEFEAISLTATTMIKGNALWLSAPGQGDFELVPLSTDAFTIKGISGYKIQFEMDGNKPVGLTSTQPNGTYKAHVKK